MGLKEDRGLSTEGEGGSPGSFLAFHQPWWPQAAPRVVTAAADEASCLLPERESAGGRKGCSQSGGTLHLQPA